MRVLLAATLTLVGLSTTQAAGLRDFRAWTVACDNVGHCRAIGLAVWGEYDDTSPWMALERAPGPEGAMTLRFGNVGGDAPVLEIDGKPLDPPIPAAAMVPLPKRDGEEEPGTGLRDPALIRRLLDAMGNAAKVTFPGADKKDGAVSLDGFKAAMRWLDDQQGRAGTVDALVAKGPKPATAVPKAQPVPRLAPLAFKPGEDKRHGKTVLEHHRTKTSEDLCDDDDRSETATPPTGTRIGPNHVLYEIPCWKAAYQAGSLYYVVDQRGAVSLAPIEWLDNKTGKVTVKTDQSVSNPDHEKPGTLVHYHKGRGLGDCFDSTTWIWDGKVFRIAAMTNQPICGGPFGEGAGFTIWRTREK